MTKTEKKSKVVINQFQPVRSENIDKKELSDYKVKEKHFNREKTYVDTKDPENPAQETVPAPWRNLHINGVKIQPIKGEPLTKKEYAAFVENEWDTLQVKERKKAQKEYWLEPVKAK